MPMRIPLSILDLVAVSAGQSPAAALEASMRAAVLADQLGYHRVWYAEHHNTTAVAASAPAVLVGHAASLTERIRVGSGGVMLPNHAPLIIAEQFGTLAQLFPGRIDLGLGRAPGTDPVTARALHRTSADPQTFAQAVWDLRGWFSETGTSTTLGIKAPVAAGTDIPMWVLGSTTAGASIAAALGLPFGVASHFAPDDLDRALQIYRSNFDPTAPTAQIDSPRVMVGVNVLVADTDEEAQREFTSTQRMFLDLARGERFALQPPVALNQLATVTELERVNQALRVSAIGSPATAVEKLERLVERTQADELITVTYSYDPAVRLRSLELLAAAWMTPEEPR